MRTPCSTNDIGLVTVTYESAGLVSYYQVTAKQFAHVWIIDNHSQDSSAALFQHALQHAEVLELKHNIGFGAANNVGFEKARLLSKYTLFLNPDCKISIPNILLLKDALELHPEATVACPAVFNTEGTCPGIKFRDYTQGYATQNVQKLEWNQQLPKIMPNGGIDGACFLVRNELFHKIGAFDENLFMYSEEDDIGLRLAAIGQTIVICPHSRAQHLGGASSKSSLRLKLRKAYHARWSRYYMLNKYAGRRAQTMAAMKSLLASPVAILLYAVTLQKRHLIKWIGNGLASVDGLFLTRYFRHLF